ncbi:MAG: hypothetical protein P8Y70_05130 [Candidatus Lokiarchaeota archaeon]
MPRVHSKYNDKELEEELTNKATEFLSTEQREAPSFIFLSGAFFDVKGFAYSALRSWKGAVKPSQTDSGRRPLLEATFASLSVYLSSLLSLQSDFYFAYEEIKDILMDKNGKIYGLSYPKSYHLYPYPQKRCMGNKYPQFPHTM